MQPDVAFGNALLRHGAADQNRLTVPRRHRGTLADKGPQLGHFGQYHGDHFQRINLVSREFPRGFGLHDQNAQHLSQALHRYTQKA